MENWKISKQFDFCYGHRVWSQELNKEFSLDSCLACRHLHGHQGKIIVHLKGNELSNGMVTDFKHLNWLKKWIDDTLDHKFIIDKNDPIFNHLFTDLAFHDEIQFNMFYEHIESENYYIPRLEMLEGVPKPVYEMYEGLIVVPFVPTSENLTKWIFNIAKEKMAKINVQVDSVEFFETPKSQSVYSQL